MAENPKLDLVSNGGEVYGLEEKMGTQKITVSDHINGFHYTADDKSDSFVIDMESFSNSTADREITANSRVSLQRNLSRKWAQRGGGDKKINPNSRSNDGDVLAAASSPLGSSTPEKSPVSVGTTDHLSNPQVHQITVTAANIGTNTDGRCVVRRNSFRRSSLWAVDPKRVLFFFATLSSIGSIFLIYFTLSIGKYSADENSLDWQQ